MSKLNTPKSQNKEVTISDSFLEKERVLDLTDKSIKIGYKERFKIWFTKLLKLPVKDKNQFLFRCQFKGNKLKQGDVILNYQGIFFAVAQVQKNRARVVTINYLDREPVCRGKFQIMPNPKDIK